MSISRRGFLIGGAATVGVVAVAAGGGYVLVEEGVVPGKNRLDQLLGACGDTGPVPTNEPGPIVHGSFTSSARNGTEVGWTVMYPPGSGPGDSLPVCISLHGRGGHNTDAVDGDHKDRFLAAAVDEGTVAPFAIASVDGGDAVNWHPRADGDDPAAMITDEFLLVLRDQGLDVSHPALWGISLGGTGALYLATLDTVQWAGVVAASPALWKNPGEWQAGAYDDEDDFAAHNLWARRDLLQDIPIRIDCGADDPFEPRVREFRDSLDPTPAGGIEPGCHDGAFWTRQAPAELEFIGASLAGAPPGP